MNLFHLDLTIISQIRQFSHIIILQSKHILILSNIFIHSHLLSFISFLCQIIKCLFYGISFSLQYSLIIQKLFISTFRYCNSLFFIHNILFKGIHSIAKFLSCQTISPQFIINLFFELNYTDLIVFLLWRLC